MENELCPTPNEACRECVLRHVALGSVPECIIIRNNGNLNNPDCECKNEKCERRTNCVECVKHHSEKTYLPSCLRS